MSEKERVGFFFISFGILNYLQKLKKTWFIHTRFYTFINNSRSKQNKEYPTHLSVDITTKRVQSFSKKYQILWQLELVKVFNFSDTKPGFLGNNRSLPYFRYRILRNLIRTTNL